MANPNQSQGGLVISSKSNSFQFYEFPCQEVKNLFKFVSLKENQCALDENQPGFYNEIIADNTMAVSFKEIVAHEIDALEEGRVQTQKLYVVEEGHFVIFKDLLITFGKNSGVKSGLSLIFKFSKVEPRPVFITPEKILKISDQMAFIKTMDFDKMEHPTIKKLRFDGKMETLADISPFHNYTSNVKSVKGVLNTPFGIRTMKISSNGKIQISKKKEEDLDSEIFLFIFKSIIKQ
ncbi:MAG TPA: hypothetical protein PK467_03150 [Candidatus Wallbacteria bacterium]|nr:hypothetical protein [Candidatus Wallbacteria bacterium]